MLHIRSVLVVHASQPIARRLMEALVARGYHVSHAETGAEVRTTLVRQPVDLVVLGLLLPDVDALELCAELAAQLPVIVCSEGWTKEARVHALQLGADAVVSPETDPDEFVALVAASLRHAARASRVGRLASIDRVTCGPLVVDRAARRVRWPACRCR